MTLGPDGHRKATEGAATLTEALQIFRDRGFDTDFRARPGSELTCGHCRRTFVATADHVEDERRLEGASDPDDMQIVIALTCPHCDAHGTVILGYGPMGDEVSQDLLDHVARR